MTGLTVSTHRGCSVRTTGALVAGLLAASMLVLVPPAGAAPAVAPANPGHPIVAVTAPTTVARTTTVYFPSGSATVGRRYEAVLAGFVAAAPRGSTVLSVRVHGYVQRSRSVANDWSLSTARAEHTAAVLKKLHVRGSYVVAGKSIAGSSSAARRATVTVTYRLPAPKPPTPPTPQKQAQTITFDQPKDMPARLAYTVGLAADKVVPANAYVAQPLVVSATSALPVTVASTTPDNCTVRQVDGTWEVSAYAVGTCRLTATQAGNTTYAAALPVTRAFAVVLRASVITFAQPSDMTWLDSDQGLTASATGVYPVTISSLTTDVCTVVDRKLHIVKPGLCNVRATRDAIGSFAAADPVDRAVTMNKASQTISWVTFPEALWFQRPADIVATSDSGLPVTYSTTTDFCDVRDRSPDPWTISMVRGFGACTVTADAEGDDYFLPATQIAQDTEPREWLPSVITFDQPSDMTWLDDDQPLTATATGGYPVTIESYTPEVCTVVDGALHIVAPGTCTLEASRSAIGDYGFADPVDRTVTINKASQTISWGTFPESLSYGKPADISATSDSELAVTLSTPDSGCEVAQHSPDPWTVAWTSGSGGNCTVAADQAGNDYFLPAPQITKDIETDALLQSVITFDQPSNMTWLDDNQSITATATGDYPVTIVSLTTNFCTVGNGKLHVWMPGSCNLRATRDAIGPYAAADPVDRTVTINKASQTLRWGVLPTMVPFGVPVIISALSDSGLPVTLTTTADCVLTDNTPDPWTITAFRNPGHICEVAAEQVGDDRFLPAERLLFPIRILPDQNK